MVVQSMINGNFQYEYFSSVTQRKVEWLWYPYIPYGKLTILQGDPGEGKSTFMLNIAALLTRGKICQMDIMCRSLKE